MSGIDVSKVLDDVATGAPGAEDRWNNTLMNYSNFATLNHGHLAEEQSKQLKELKKKHKAVKAQQAKYGKHLLVLETVLKSQRKVMGLEEKEEKEKK